VAAARRTAPDFAVVDASPRGVIDDDVLPALLPAAPTAKIVVVTANGSIAAAVGAMRRGVRDYLTKPIDAETVVAALERLDAGAPPAPRAAPELTPSLARATWEHLQRILVATNGNVSETARRLGIPRRSLQFKLKKAPPVG
jgi:two-component system response regulator RegA